MFGCPELPPVGAGGVLSGAGSLGAATPGVSVASASFEAANPAPTSAPPARMPDLTNVRRSILLSSFLRSSGVICGARVRAGAVAALLVLGLAGASAGAATDSPVCVPSTLNNSAQLDGSVTVSPLPGSRDATPQTQISFLGISARELSAVSVSGSRTGPHGGRLEPYSQGDGASFVPARAVRRRRDRHRPRAAPHGWIHPPVAGSVRDRASGPAQLDPRDDPRAASPARSRAFAPAPNCARRCSRSRPARPWPRRVRADRA